MKLKSKVFVLIQFACIAYFALFGGLIAHSILLIALQVLAVIFALWAILIVGLPSMSIFPEPKKQGGLKMTGPFRWVRHPMYTGVLVYCFVLMLEDSSWISAAVYVTLLVNQLAKLRFEEHLLEMKYSEYSSYQKRSWKLIPFLY